MQGGIVRLLGGTDAAQITGTPVQLTSSAMRARFNPTDGQLYVAGLSGWQSDAVALTGFDRDPLHRQGGAQRAGPGRHHRRRRADLQPPPRPQARSTRRASRCSAGTTAARRRTARPSCRWTNPAKRGHDRVEVLQARLSADGKSVLLDLDDLRPAHQMLIQLRVKASDGTPIRQSVMHTIHKLPRDPRAGQGPRVAVQRPRGEPGLLLRARAGGAPALAGKADRPHRGGARR